MPDHDSSDPPGAQFSAVILAGGRGSRMGQPKATMRFGPATMLERIVARLAGEFRDIVIVAAPGASLPVTALGVRVIHDDVAHEGPVGALARDSAPRSTIRSSPLHAICRC